jgi:hypothetical protein
VVLGRSEKVRSLETSTTVTSLFSIDGIHVAVSRLRGNTAVKYLSVAFIRLKRDVRRGDELARKRQYRQAAIQASAALISATPQGVLKMRTTVRRPV